MPPNWTKRCLLTLKRDQYLCRRCGTVTCITTKAVDHIIPRRLFLTGVAASTPRNCAVLCTHCHGWKTSVLEPALYRGDVLAFRTFLSLLEQTGPVPKAEIIGDALGRLRRLLDAEARQKTTRQAKTSRVRRLARTRL
jgi:hypothetical protein